MKKLTFLTLFLSVSALAAGSEVTTRDDANQIISTIKDIEVTKLLSETSQFKKCRDDYEYVENDPNRDAKLQAAVACLKQELGTGADSAKKLEELSKDLNLQTYGLVKSNNSKEIQKYLTNKMIQTLTGVNPEEKEHQKIIENLKFGKRKQVDQAVFIKMYKTQLGKNALFEISRFCFEDLRLETSSNTNAGNDNFLTHWKADLSPLADEEDISKVNDLGKPKFGSNLAASGDKQQIYQEIFKSIQGTGQVPASTQQFLSEFFLKCGKLIVPLCKEFKKGINLTSPETSQTTLGESTNSTPTKGAAACLAQSRIQEYKKALANADLVADYFEKEMSGSSSDLSAFMKGLDGEPIKRFGDGSDANEATIDELTNNSSMAFLEAPEDETAKRKAEECNQNPELSKCEGFIYQDDTLDKVKHKVELEMTLKREVEMERVKKLKALGEQDIKKYLEENGFYELLKDDAYATMSAAALAEAVGKSFEAKKRATLAEINQRLGFRQVKDNAELAQPNKAKELTEDSQDERARLSQVVLFNNIITSHLSLKKKDSSGNLSDAGRNVGAWRKEEQALSSGNIDENLFANLKASDDESTGIGRDAQIADFSLLDEILGKPPGTPE